MSFVILFAAIILFVGFVFLRTRFKASRLTRLSWDDLVAKLERVPVNGIATVAVDYLQPSKGQMRLEPDMLWALVGGSDGVRKMAANAEILIALAGYAQRWNRDESVIVAERMRRDGMALRRATDRLSLGLAFGLGNVHGPFNVQQAASSYYLMRQRLLALYESGQVARYSSLANAI